MQSAPCKWNVDWSSITAPCLILSHRIRCTVCAWILQFPFSSVRNSLPWLQLQTEKRIFTGRGTAREKRERERYQQQSFSGVTQSTRAQVKQTSKAIQHADVVNRGAGAKRGLGGERSSDLTVSRSHPEYQINHIQLCEGSTKETFKLAADYRTFPCAWRLKG